MKKICLILLMLCVITCVDAQNSLFRKSGKTNTSEPKRNPVSLPLGIDTREVRLSGSPGSSYYVRGIQEGVREKITSANRDATRYLENAVKEDPDNLEKIRKLLDAGASAFVSYDMIDKKQYDLMDLMHKSNPKLIRFSQMLHYACAHCKDTAMIDFLIERGASLDLCGDYWEIENDPNYGQKCFHLCEWNSDGRYYYTPQDVAWRMNNRLVCDFIIDKYGKYPTMLGIARGFYNMIKNASVPIAAIDCLKGADSFFDFNKIVCQGKWDFEEAITKMLNTEIVWINRGSFGYRDILSYAIEQLGAARRQGDKEKSEKLEELVRLMIDKGAKVDYTERRMSIMYMSGLNVDEATYFNTPLLAAMKEPNMIDIIKLLKDKGAPMKIKVSQHGRTYEIPIKDGPIRDEYKEAIFLGEL